jgi:hypothetical protein
MLFSAIHGGVVASGLETIINYLSKVVRPRARHLKKKCSQIFPKVLQTQAGLTFN